MNKGKNPVNTENRKENARDSEISRSDQHKAKGVMNGEDFDRFQARLDSVGGNREIYDICFGQPGDYPAMD